MLNTYHVSQIGYQLMLTTSNLAFNISDRILDKQITRIEIHQRATPERPYIMALASTPLIWILALVHSKNKNFIYKSYTPVLVHNPLHNPSTDRLKSIRFQPRIKTSRLLIHKELHPNALPWII